MTHRNSNRQTQPFLIAVTAIITAKGSRYNDNNHQQLHSVVFITYPEIGGDCVNDVISATIRPVPQLQVTYSDFGTENPVRLTDGTLLDLNDIRK